MIPDRPHGLVTLQEAAADLGRPVKTIDNWVRRYKLPTRKTGKTLWVRLQDIWDVERRTRVEQRGRPRQ